MSDDDHGLAALLGGGADSLGGRARREPLVGLRLQARRSRELPCGLSRAQQRARQHRVGAEAFAGEPLTEGPGRLAAFRGERPELVRLPGRSLGVTHDHQPHGPEHSLPLVRTFRYVVADVFTDTPLEGNALAVFTDGRGLDDAEMQRLARELNLSETVFVLPPEIGGHARIRIFTPSVELPFAGHPTLGSAFVLGGPLQVLEIRLETVRGIVPVALERDQGRIVFGRMVQPLPTWKPYGDAEALLAALGLERSELPVEHYDNGAQFVYVGLGSVEELAALRPDVGALLDLSGLLGVDRKSVV